MENRSISNSSADDPPTPRPFSNTFTASVVGTAPEMRYDPVPVALAFHLRFSVSSPASLNSMTSWPAASMSIILSIERISRRKITSDTRTIDSSLGVNAPSRTGADHSPSMRKWLVEGRPEEEAEESEDAEDAEESCSDETDEE